ncbi:hypothetical protein [Hydrogeniiclostridium mannosilyticum]|uniref:hypothetical protein n=1 Tax=Hydrogeniiclostridium mannosilyticum TaxID=2764322 RepID=UPI0018A9B1DE|nr:hypothetical protein [Hydrogeniiclostridium mannosilyticum]
MLEIAENSLKKVKLQAYTQCIVVLTDKQKIYHKIIANALSEENAVEFSFLNELKSNHDTKIKKIVCMWGSGDIDLPSWKLRKMLCEVNLENQKAQMLLLGKPSYIVKNILQTLK